MENRYVTLVDPNDPLVTHDYGPQSGVSQTNLTRPTEDPKFQKYVKGSQLESKQVTKTETVSGSQSKLQTTVQLDH